MIILTAGHTGAGTGAQCTATHFDEGAENIWLRNRIAEILTNKYGLAVLMDDDTASLKLLVKELNQTGRQDDTKNHVLMSSCRNQTSEASPQSVQICRATLAQQESESLNPNGKKSFQSVLSVGDKSNPDGTRSDDFVIDLHFNAHGNPQARGTETIVADDATELELRMASRLAHVTSDALDIPLRCIKSESQTPHRRLAMLHLTPQSIILEVCFCTSPEDVEAYRNNREKLAAELAWAIAELLPSVVSTDNSQQTIVNRQVRMATVDR